MSPSKSALVAAISVVCALVLASSASAATTVIRTDPGGGRVPSGTTVTATSEGTTTINLDGTGSISCQGSFQGSWSTTEGNPSVSGSLSALSLVSCVDTLPIITIDFCAKHGSSSFTAAATSSLGGTITFGETTVFCHVFSTGTPGTGCYLDLPSSAGSFTNSNSTLGFSNAPLVHTVPSGTTNDIGAFCGNTGSFGGNFANVHNFSGRITLATS